MGNHMEVIWKSYGSPKPPKIVTSLVLEAYGTHMEIHMEIIFPSLMSLTSIWNHMEVTWNSNGSPEQKKMLLGSFWEHMEPIWKSIWKSYFHVLCYQLRSGTIWKSYGSHIEVPNKEKCY